jgi:hypothetical protein
MSTMTNNPSHLESLPVSTKSHDILRDGVPGSDVFQLGSGQHIPPIARNPVQTKFSTRINNVREVYGIGAALSRVAEVRKAQEFHRLPGFTSSFLALDVRTGEHKNLGIQDIYGDMADAPVCDPFATLEKATTDGWQ